MLKPAWSLNPHHLSKLPLSIISLARARFVVFCLLLRLSTSGSDTGSVEVNGNTAQVCNTDAWPICSLTTVQTSRRLEEEGCAGFVLEESVYLSGGYDTAWPGGPSAIGLSDEECCARCASLHGCVGFSVYQHQCFFSTFSDSSCVTYSSTECSWTSLIPLKSNEPL